jgi:hypothetical protein
MVAGPRQILFLEHHANAHRAIRHVGVIKVQALKFGHALVGWSNDHAPASRFTKIAFVASD